MAVIDYRTRDGLADYGFSVEFQPDKGWRVYIIFQPLDNGCDDNLRLPYQSIDDNGRCYVDWPGKLDNLGDARTVAGLWAERVQSYRRTQEQNALYVELIEQYQHAQAQRKTNPASQDRLDDTAVGAGRPSPAQRAMSNR
jgi:hypothetical protein